MTSEQPNRARVAQLYPRTATKAYEDRCDLEPLPSRACEARPTGNFFSVSFYTAALATSLFVLNEMTNEVSQSETVSCAEVTRGTQGTRYYYPSSLAR